jgi:hypothetical protein
VTALDDLIGQIMAEMPESWDVDNAPAALVVEFVQVLAARARHAGVSLERNVDRLPGRPPVVTLCGSTLFRPDFDRVTRELTMAGYLVIGPGVWWSEESGKYEAVQAAAVKEALDALHLRKIDLADTVMVVNPDGYIGESTAAEIAYAEASGKPVRYMYPRPAPTRPSTEGASPW